MSPAAKTYFLLPEPVPGARINDLLGRAVYIDKDSLKHPTESTIRPILPPNGPDLKLLEPNLYPSEIKAKSAEVLLEKASDASAKASISKVLNLFYKHSKSSESTMTIPVFRRITMEERHQKLENLLKKEEFSGPIVDFFQSYPEAKFGIIVSIISCFSMTVGNKKSEEREGGGDTTIPAGQAAGAPGPVGDIKAEVKAGGNTKAEVSGTYDDEVIMACAYTEMRLKKPERGWQFWKTHKLTPDDIVFTSQAIHPTTMKVSAPATRIPGDQEAILGGISQGNGEASTDAAHSKTELTDEEDDDDEESDFVLFV